MNFRIFCPLGLCLLTLTIQANAAPCSDGIEVGTKGYFFDKEKKFHEGEVQKCKADEMLQVVKSVEKGKWFAWMTIPARDFYLVRDCPAIVRGGPVLTQESHPSYEAIRHTGPVEEHTSDVCFADFFLSNGGVLRFYKDIVTEVAEFSIAQLKDWGFLTVFEPLRIGDSISVSNSFIDRFDEMSRVVKLYSNGTVWTGGLFVSLEFWAIRTDLVQVNPGSLRVGDQLTKTFKRRYYEPFVANYHVDAILSRSNRRRIYRVVPDPGQDECRPFWVDPLRSFYFEKDSDVSSYASRQFQTLQRGDKVILDGRPDIYTVSEKKVGYPTVTVTRKLQSKVVLRGECTKLVEGSDGVESGRMVQVPGKSAPTPIEYVLEDGTIVTDGEVHKVFTLLTDKAPNGVTARDLVYLPGEVEPISIEYVLKDGRISVKGGLVKNYARVTKSPQSMAWTKMDDGRVVPLSDVTALSDGSYIGVSLGERRRIPGFLVFLEERLKKSPRTGLYLPDCLTSHSERAGLSGNKILVQDSSGSMKICSDGDCATEVPRLDGRTQGGHVQYRGRHRLIERCLSDGTLILIGAEGDRIRVLNDDCLDCPGTSTETGHVVPSAPPRPDEQGEADYFEDTGGEADENEPGAQ